LIHGEWVSCILAKDGTESAECDLGRVYETAIVLLPTLDSGTITVRGRKETGGTSYDLYTYNHADGHVDKIITAATTGGYFCIFPIGGYQYLTFKSGVAQTTDAVTFYAMGVRS